MELGLSQEVGLSGLTPGNARVSWGKWVNKKLKPMYNLYMHTLNHHAYIEIIFK